MLDGQEESDAMSTQQIPTFEEIREMFRQTDLKFQETDISFFSDGKKMMAIEHDWRREANGNTRLFEFMI